MPSLLHLMCFDKVRHLCAFMQMTAKRGTNLPTDKVTRKQRTGLDPSDVHIKKQENCEIQEFCL